MTERRGESVYPSAPLRQDFEYEYAPLLFGNGETDHAQLFKGTRIMTAGEKYLSEMGRYPVIALSLKSMKQDTYKEAFHCLKEEIAREFKKHPEVAGSLALDDDREKYTRLMNRRADEEEYLTSLKFLSECLASFYGEKQ